MCPAGCPFHLLLLHHALADHLVHRRFNEGRADRLAVSVAFAENSVTFLFWRVRLRLSATDPSAHTTVSQKRYNPQFLAELLGLIAASLCITPTTV
jgi:hypothetical protein